MLGFAHTVGEFGVILMIGGNIPGRTRVMSTAIFDFVETMRWREANLLAGGMVAFAFAVILSMILVEKRFDASRRVSDESGDPRGVSGHDRQVRARRRLHRSGQGRDRAVRPIGLRQDHGAALHRRPLAHRRRCARSTATSGRTRTARSCRPTGGRSATSSRKRACSRTSRCAAIFCSARRAHDAGDARATIDFDEVVELLGVTRLLDRTPRNLSGGERQRVAIGRALLSQPKLLLMDEPLSALDRATKNEILPFLERLRDRLKLPIVYITHDIAEVERLADQIVLMDKGRVIGAGPLEDLQSDPSLPCGCARRGGELDGVVEASDERYGLVTLKVRGGVAGRARAPGAIGEHRRIRVMAGDVSLAREAPGPELDPECPAGEDRVGEAGRIRTRSSRRRRWSRRRRRAHPVAPHAKVVEELGLADGRTSTRRSRPSRSRRGAANWGERASWPPLSRSRLRRCAAGVIAKASTCRSGVNH